MRVVFGDWLSANFATFDDKLRLQVARFAIHVEKYGVKGLQGRNKSSADLTDTTKKGRERAKFAQKYCLWHYHLGVPFYVEQTNGEFTSEYILHYCYYDDLIVLVDIDTHPPFYLPDEFKMTHS